MSSPVSILRAGSRRALSVVLAGALLAQGAAPAAAAPLVVKVGEAKAFSRLELRGAVGVRREGDTLVVRLPRSAAPDMARLHVDPPPYLADATLKPAGGQLELRLKLAKGADAKSGFADGATWINLFPTPAPSKDQPASTARLDPVPASGVVRMQAQDAGGAVRLRFPWRAPPGAAVFRRGERVWVVFDAHARIDLSAAPRGLRQAKDFQASAGPGWSALRFTSPPDTPISAGAEGAMWTVSLGASIPADPVKVDASVDGPATLVAHVAGATGVFWLPDPVVGDTLAVVTALPPAKGLAERRSLVQAELLASVQGLAVRPLADDLTVSSDGDLVSIGRPMGLALTPPGAVQRRAGYATAALPQPAALPGLVDFAAWSQAGEGGFNARYAALLDGAAAETAKGRGAPMTARLALARFLVGSELSFEAIGVLNTLVKIDPTLAADPEFRGLRGAARAMAGRYKDAQADFSSPVTASDPASSLWRGYAAAKLGDMTGARAQFAAGEPALGRFAPAWRARFALADADAALAAGDVAAARRLVSAASAAGPQGNDALAVQLASARIAEASGHADQALPLYEAVSKSSYGALSAPATLKVVQLRLARGAMPVTEAADTLDSLRFRWRGDAVELQTIRALGALNLQQGRYREALAVLRSAGTRLPDLPESVALQTDLSTAFKALFLNGQADGLQPIQALALFYDFKELTPVGADGDTMVRRLVKRLVDVDLLDQAAELLKYQVDNRLDGVPKAQVSTDLAVLYLMDRRPEDALGAINASRTTLLPNALNAQRRLVEARALLDLGRGDHALEVLGKDPSPDAAELRGLAAWRAHDWPAAGKAAEVRLGDRWKSPTPLTPVESALLIRAGTAYSLAQDDPSLARLRTRYAKLAEASPDHDTLRVALAGVEGAEGGGVAQVARGQADAQVFAGWVARMKARFREAPNTPATPLRSSLGDNRPVAGA